MGNIDFVLLWVDGNDPAWLAEKEKYLPDTKNESSAENRFRDWNNLHYWFRAVEKYAPWVNKIHFITWGHVPKWLNTKHKKLNIVKHEEYIPEKYLPTFNSNVIELNLHRIPGLAERFVLFNDDTFLCNKVSPDFFFKKGLPADAFVNTAIYSPKNELSYYHMLINNIAIINKNFNKRQVMKDNFTKCFSPKYGMKNFMNLCLLPWPCFTGFFRFHMPQPHLKSTFREVWKKEPYMFENAMKNRFRGDTDISHWVIRDWNLCSGKFNPKSLDAKGLFFIGRDTSELCDYIIKQKGEMLCMNDSDLGVDFVRESKIINKAFQKVLPKKSTYEI